MNKNLNLVEILKDCPKGTKLYSTIFGDVELEKISNDENDKYPIFIRLTANTIDCVAKDGRYIGNYDGECVLFPSKELRDWSKFNHKKPKFVPKFKVGDMIRHKKINKNDVYEISKVSDEYYGIAGFPWMICMKYQDQYELVPNKFDPRALKSFDKVLVRDKSCYNWECELFSRIKPERKFKYWCISNGYKYCIPYNDDTKHLVGTTDEAPEFYRYWED